MPTRTVISDENGNAVSCYLNTEGKAYISVHQDNEGPLEGNFILLSKEDLMSFIEQLQEMHADME